MEVTSELGTNLALMLIEEELYIIQNLFEQIIGSESCVEDPICSRFWKKKSSVSSHLVERIVRFVEAH